MVETRTTHARLALDDETRRFLAGPVGVVVAVRGRGLVPDLAPGLGCRVLEDGTIRVLVARSQSEDVVTAIGANGVVAVVFSRPTDHKTVQVKAVRAVVVDADDDDLDAVSVYRRVFADELARVGFGGPYAEAMLDAADGDLAAITFTVAEAFDQTPGPNAGSALAVAERS